MGQYLMICVIRHANFSASCLQTTETKIEEFLPALEKRGIYDPSLHDITHEDGLVGIKLKENVLTQQLAPFLNAFYKGFYGNSSEGENAGANELQNLPKPSADRRLDAEKLRQFRDFESDYDYGMRDYIPISPKPQKGIRVWMEGVALTREGKVLAEGIDNHLHFFAACIKAKFAAHPLAKAIKVYIYG